MALYPGLLETLHEIEAKYPNGAYLVLPDNHPDIIRLHTASKSRKERKHVNAKPLYWTDERKAELKRLYLEGGTINGLARQLGKSNATISSQLRLMGVSTQKKQWRAVAMLSKEGEFLKEFPNIAEAEREIGVSGVRECVNGRCKTSGGYKWRYADECKG